MQVHISTRNAEIVAEGFLNDATLVQEKARAALTTVAMLLRTEIQINASGRPGPNVITGDYRRSWAVEVREEGYVIEAEVGTNEPQGWRLEMGFHGADSLGRYYNQPPYPHVGPAVDAIVRPMEETLATALPK